MHLQLRNRLEALEERKRALVARVRSLPTDRQRAHASAKTFSPVEVLMHLALSEKGATDTAQKLPHEQAKTLQPKPSFIFRQAVNGLKAANRWLPTTHERVPDPKVTLDEAEQAWDWARSDLKSVLEWAESPNSVVSKSLVMGTLSAGQLLDLAEAHLHYHEVRFPEV